MICGACGYVFDPSMGEDEIVYDSEMLTEMGGTPFITSDEMPNIYACPVCGTLKLDVAAAGMKNPKAPQAEIVTKVK